MRSTITTVVAALLAGLLAGVGSVGAQVDAPLAISASGTTGLVDGDEITVTVTGRTAPEGWLVICPAGTDYLDGWQRQGCTSTSIVRTDEATTSRTLRVNRFTRFWPTDCAAEPCEVAYAGFDGTFNDITEAVAIPVAFAAQPVPLVASPTTDLVVGQTVDVTFASGRNLAPIVPPATREGPFGFVGICPGSADPVGEGVTSFECEGLDLTEEELSGNVEIPVQRFYENDQEVFDCLDDDIAGCWVVFSVQVIEAEDSPPDKFFIEEYRIPLDFRQSVSINGGGSSAPVGSTVAVEAYGQTTAPGAAGFVMLCNLDPDRPGLAGLVCSGSGGGTVEGDYDGQLVGGIEMPATMTAGGITFDCTGGRGCLVVYAAIGPDLRSLGGAAAWVRAIELA